MIFFQLFMHIASELFKLTGASTDQRIVLVPRTQRNKYHKDVYFQNVIFLNVEIPPTLLNFV